LGVAALEDKMIQQAVVAILNQIYEVDFKGFSYGFPAFCTLIPMRASTPLILRRSRMRKRARTALCWGAISDGRPYRDS
jgi:hypothetical protein